MDVYVIPTGRDRYELYCESPAPAAPEPAEASGSWFSRLSHRFAYMVHEAETQERGVSSRSSQRGWWDRLNARLMGWVVERIAEQRLLWNLRREEVARLSHPADMSFDQSLTLVKRMLRRDYDRHRLWLGVNGTLLVLSAVLAIVPGPNLVAYYFAFRVVGHWLSMRGASQGLSRITWTGDANVRLVDLRQAILHEASRRRAEVEAVGTDLGLPSLAAFVERVAPPVIS
jgi:hypothetical protein